jgi:protease I
MEGSTVNPDLMLSEIKMRDYDGICFIGGVGCIQYWRDKEGHNLAVMASRTGLLLGAICLAPVILANAGLLIGKRVTGYPSAKTFLKKKGAIYSGIMVESDSNIITAKDQEAAKAFGICPDFCVQNVVITLIFTERVGGKAGKRNECRISWCSSLKY